MPNTDHVTKDLLKDDHIFADIFNNLFFKNKVIDPDRLKDMNTDEILVDYHKLFSTEKHRDIMRNALIRHDGRYAYLYLGIENQNEIDDTMPARVMLYDALNYHGQMKIIRNRNKENKSLSKKEYLSGFTKDDRLIPVITLVICWSPEKWTGPRSIHDMMDPKMTERFKGYIPDYPMNLISLNELDDETIRSMETKVSLLFEFLKYSNNSQKVREYRRDKRFEDIPYEIARSIKVMSDIDIDLEKNDQGGSVNMCEGWKVLLEEEKNEGRTEGISIGKTEERKESLDKLIRYFMNNGRSEEEAIREADIVFGDPS
ncbi:MAG: Rpn family recombination-promoting nuclease/putative transposase [Erysipelotrichaceae bacterium]|nr:Rpn family recombination-promoting nuclease/putative transposase [Erysipelotrichaceae bacterium]